MNSKYFIIACLLVFSIASASVALLEPVRIMMNEGKYLEDGSYFVGEYDLGKIGPGQELDLVFSRNTGPNGTESKASIFWEKATSTVQQYSYEMKSDKIILKIIMPKGYRGVYVFNVTMLGVEVGTITPHTITFKVFVTEDVYEYYYDANAVSIQGQTIIIPISIKSNSIAEDVLFFDNTKGMPSKWIQPVSVKMPPLSQHTVMMRVTPNEEGFYDATLLSRHAGFNDALPLKLRVYPDFMAKARAFSQGFSITAIILQPFYSLISFMTSL